MNKISTQSISLKYIIALSILAVLSVSSYLILQKNINAQRTDAAVVNISGRQRMLSQRIALKANLLVNATDEIERDKLRAGLMTEIALMERSHNALLYGDAEMGLPGNPSQHVYSMFFLPPVSLDLRVRNYLKEAKALFDAPSSKLTQDNPHLLYITEKSTVVLTAINSLVTSYQAESEAAVSTLHVLEEVVLISNLIVLLIIAVFLFRPMVILIKHEAGELQRAEERSRTVMEMVADGIITVNERGVIESFNIAAEKIFGYKASEVTGSNIKMLVPEPHRSKHDGYIEKFIHSGGPICGREITGQRKDGLIVDMELYVSEIKLHKERLFISSLRDITERKKMEKKLEDAAVTDELTRLLNRRGFLTLSEQQLKIADRQKKNLTLLYLDIDNMKSINDTLGHKEGDRALIDISTVLIKTLRESDIIARIGGDEFAILLTDPPPDFDNIIIRHIRDNLRSHNETHKSPIELSLSIGISQYDPEHPSSIDDLLKSADAMMYKDKKSRKDR